MNTPTMPAHKMSGSLPKPVGRMLKRLDRHLRAVSLVRGLGTTAMVMSVVMAIGMIADFIWVLPQTARWGIWGAAVGTVAGAFAVFVLGATLRRRSAFELAAVAERGHPALEERLTGAVGLLGSGPLSHGSPSLIAAVADRAAEQARQVEATRVIPWKSACIRLASGLGALGLIAAPCIWWPDTYGRLARHFLFPWSNVASPGRHVLTVSPGDTAVPIGADLSVSASIRSRLPIDAVPEEASLDWGTVGDSARHRLTMPPVPVHDSPSHGSAKEFELTLPRLARTIWYRVQCGSVSSPRYEITVVEPPSVATIKARVEPPEYTKLPAKLVAEASRIEAFEGSRVTLAVKATRQVRSIEIEWPAGTAEKPGGEKFAAPLHENEREGSVTVIAARSGPYTVSLCDPLGITSRPEEERWVIVRADAPPVVEVREPAGVTDVSPGDTLRVGIAARDDIAVESVELHYDVSRGDSSTDGGETAHVAVPLKGLSSPKTRGEASLALLPLGLKPGDSFSYRVRVADNRPAPRGPNVVWSASQTLSVVAAAEPLRVRASRARSSSLRGKLDALRKDVVAERGTTDRLRQAAEAVEREDGEWDETQSRSLEEREAAARNIEDRLKLLARELGADPGRRDLARTAQQVANVEAEAALVALEQAGRERDAAARQAGLERSVSRLAAVSARLDDLAHKFDLASQEGARINRLNELAKRQEDLAATATAMNGDRAQSDRVQAEQQTVQIELDALVEQTPALRAQLLDGHLREAERLAAQARALAERQRAEPRRTVDLGARAVEFNELAALQRDLEDDARKLAVTVDQPLAENGRGRVNTEVIRQAVEPIERGNVEGAVSQLDRAEIELRRQARDLEDVQVDPKAKAGRLFRRQDALNREIDLALQSMAGKTLTPEQQATFTARLKRLGQRENAIAELAKTIAPPPGKEARQRFPHDAARDAIAATARAAAALASQNPTEIANRKDESRRALERLANELPDPWRRQEPTRQKFDEARRNSNEVADEITRHLRETDPRPDHPATSAGAAAELAQRLQNTADKEARAVEALEAMEPEPHVLPQRDRALARAKALTAVLRDLRNPATRERARKHVAGTLVEAKAAMDRLEQKQGGRMPADDLAHELAADERSIEEVSSSKATESDVAARARLARREREIAGALRGLKVPDAELAQDEAIQLAERAAQTLAGPNPNPMPAALAAVREAAHAAQALADRLADRQSQRAQVSALGRAQRALTLPEAQSDPVRAGAKQKAIGGELARLAVAKKDATAQRVDRAAELTERSLEADRDQIAASRPNPESLAEARTQAALSLEALAGELPDKTPEPQKLAAPTSQPGAAEPELALKPEHAASARELALRQRRIRERVQAMLGDFAAPQQALRAEAVALGHDLADLRDRVRPLSSRAHFPAHDAANHLGIHAPQAMDQGVTHLAEGQARAAREDQHRAAELVERGAQLAQDLAAALRADRNEVPSGATSRASDAMSQQSPEKAISGARRQMSRAAQELDQARDPARVSQSVPAARQAMLQAARDLQTAAQIADATADSELASFSGDDEPGSPGDGQAPPSEAGASAGGASLEPESSPGGKADPELTKLKDMVRQKTGRKWGELPGHLRNQILQMQGGRYRDDYARVIQLYFREIAGAGTTEVGANKKQ